MITNLFTLVALKPQANGLPMPLVRMLYWLNNRHTAFLKPLNPIRLYLLLLGHRIKYQKFKAGYFPDYFSNRATMKLHYSHCSAEEWTGPSVDVETSGGFEHYFRGASFWTGSLLRMFNLVNYFIPFMMWSAVFTETTTDDKQYNITSSTSSWSFSKCSVEE